MEIAFVGIWTLVSQGLSPLHWPQAQHPGLLSIYSGDGKGNYPSPLQKQLKLMKHTFTWGPSVVTSSVKASTAMVLKSIHHRCDKRYAIDFLRYCIIAILKSLSVLKGCVNRFKFSKSCWCFARRSARQWQLTQPSNFRKQYFLLFNRSIPRPWQEIRLSP